MPIILLSLIFFPRFGKRFELALVAQSIVMLISMILMLEISVRTNRKHVYKTQRASALSIFTNFIDLLK